MGWKMSDAEQNDRPHNSNGFLIPFISHYTVFKMVSGSDRFTPGGKFYLITAVGAVSGLVTALLLFIALTIEGFFDRCEPLNAIICALVPIAIYGFSTLGGFARTFDRLFPDQKRGDGLGIAGIAGIIAMIVFMYSMYSMIGPNLALVVLPTIEISAAVALVAGAAFGFSNIVSMPKPDITDIVMSLIFGIVFMAIIVSIFMVAGGYFETMFLLMGVLTIVISLVIGILLGKISDRFLGNMDEDITMGFIEVCRPLLFLVIIVLFFLL
ncbi:hypothetical protein AUP07_0253 [methanogenic archaeon mixed culture ISO4-G1]|nr:hypothetical protein AUP07_0253 [methanogenic archaeon mixed culture ISO4-G1]